MIFAQQIQPGQLTAVPATTVTGAQDIGTLLTSIMPLIMIMMVMTKIATHPSLQTPTGDSASGDETP